MPRRTLLIVICSLLALTLLTTGCPQPGTDATVSLKMQVEGFDVADARAFTQQNITPTTYSVALVNLSLTRAGGDPVVLVDETEDDPLIVDFTNGDLQDILDGITLPADTYTGFTMQALYFQMSYQAAFHVPAISDEHALDLDLLYDDDTDVDTYTFRLYFNAIDNLWKRDFLVYLSDVVDTSLATVDELPDGWYWMRRALEGSQDNFFILAQEDGVTYDDTDVDPDNDWPAHPAGGAAPNSTIDLFANDAFWGDEADYDDSSTPIIISTDDDSGEVNATFTSFVINGDETSIILTLDVFETMNFQWSDDPDVTMATDPEVLDLGPDYDPDLGVSGDEMKYGDQGLHPFLPRFELTVE